MTSLPWNLMRRRRRQHGRHAKSASRSSERWWRLTVYLHDVTITTSYWLWTVDMPDAPTEEEKDSQDAPIDKEAPSQPSEAEATVTVQGGRRRGKRRVMKKKKVQDEDGYLGMLDPSPSLRFLWPPQVTKEEAVWESFSEDEPEPKRAKPAPKPTTAKGKKTSGKGQGSIASFFKKA
jgi:DNA polymerase delta subunit 3